MHCVCCIYSSKTPPAIPVHDIPFPRSVINSESLQFSFINKRETQFNNTPPPKNKREQVKTIILPNVFGSFSEFDAIYRCKTCIVVILEILYPSISTRTMNQLSMH